MPPEFYTPVLRPRPIWRCRLVVFLIALLFWTTLLATALEIWLRSSATRVIESNTGGSGIFAAADPELLIRNTTRGRRLVPGARARILNHRLSGLDIDMEINSIGFRDGELSSPKREDEFRVLVLGDSITWADYLPADSVYVECAERLLDPAPDGRRVELINAGVGDIGLREEVHILLESGLDTQPELVVLGFYLNDSRPPWGFAGELGRPGWLRRHSALAAEIYREFQLNRWLKEQGKPRYEWIYAVDQLPWRSEPEALERLVQLAQYDWGAAWQPGSWITVESELARLRGLADRHSFAVLVLAFPVRFQVEADYVDDRPQKELERRSRSHGFDFLDLLPLLRAHRGQPLFYDHCHPNPAAHQRIGQALAERISLSLDSRTSRDH